MISPLAAAALLASCSAETQEAHYDDLEEARAEGAVDQGWIPEWVPEEARNIQEMHDLDTNAQLLAFTVGSRTMPEPCEELAVDPEGPSLSADWFPRRPGSLTKQCGEFHAVLNDGRIHAWTNGGAG
ncbi:hypothetical protein CDO52_02350 [Nocardiopsis gilva YIM 90087]|uniref:YbbD head domain-containing protein n=1 Tax=Nocardiopsis gilva YIM 90087 TaxID=1235441 RepID=A0A223S0Z6_9ACTN|nr:hypothetical protein [Nocardiopsis gilva]ASU81784.1 hypothetical protein CDO52_02350 [Nocardiopsis gilva YIM 90087]